MKASDLTLDRNTSILMKGPFGFGKTIAAASFALAGPTYIAYFDKKRPIELLTYFARFGVVGKKILDNIEYDVYGAENAHDYLNKVKGFTKDFRYVNFITDSVTNLTAAAVNWSLGFRDTKKEKVDKVNAAAPALIPDWDEYKVETSLVSQALDICKSLPGNIIWTAHPLPSLKLEGSGNSVKVTKTVNIVTYGSKVAGIVPGNFTEIYHFSKKVDYTGGTTNERYIVDLRAVGDDFAKTALFDDSIRELDITGRLFYEVWKEGLDLSMINLVNKLNATEAEVTKPNDPFKPSKSKWSV